MNSMAEDCVRDPAAEEVVGQARYERARQLLMQSGWTLVRRCETGGYFAACQTRARYMADIADLESLAVVGEAQPAGQRT